jgi:YYY domain-containing protein
VRDALTWYVVVQAMAIAVWPVVARALVSLDDRGWAVSKTAGLLGSAWLVWLACMLTPLPFTRVTLAVAVLGIGLSSWTYLVRVRALEATLNWMRERWRLLLAWETVFLAAFVLFAVLRTHNPTIAGTEKWMDMAFLNGFMTAPRLPTQDTWLSGYSVPYYYFGYFVLACVGKLSDVVPGIAYNLAAATVPALAIVGVTSLAWTLARAAGVGAAWAAVGGSTASLLALVCGNLSALFELLFTRRLIDRDAGELLGIKRFGEGFATGVWPPENSFWWFKASRVIPNLQPDGINEFPFFSAFLSDLHPHFVALPFEVLVISVAAAHVLSRGETLRSAWTQGLGALALGGLLVINTWDIAAFWTLYVGLSLYALYLLRTSWIGRWRWATAVLAPLVGALLYAPYFVAYSGPPLGLGIVIDRTPLGSLLVLFGWAIVLLAALGLFARWCIGDRRGWQTAAGGAVAGVVLMLLGQPSLGILVALVATLLPWPAAIERLEPGAAAALGLGAFAATMLLGVEVIFLDDVFHSRMNTVFKFHENAWLLAGLASGVGVALVGHFTRRARWVVTSCAAVLLVAGLVYPLTAMATRMAERPPTGPTLDGLTFLSPDERAAVRWLSDQNAASSGRVIIAEGVGEQYSMAARMATYSGASTVLGWAGHELQWRGPIAELGVRAGDLALLYRDAPPETVRPILDRYAVRFVVVGEIERNSYGERVTTRFDGILPVAFRAGNTVIYRTR